VLVNRNGDAKLADFGASTRLNETVTKRRTLVGTPFWMAPEVIEQAPYDGKADIWSLGITAIELAKKEPPLASVHPMKVLFMIPKNPPPKLDESYSKNFQDFVGCCLQKDPDLRPTPPELLRQSQFLQSARRTSVLEGLVAERNRSPEVPHIDISLLNHPVALGLGLGATGQNPKPNPNDREGSNLSLDGGWVFTPSSGCSPNKAGEGFSRVSTPLSKHSPCASAISDDPAARLQRKSTLSEEMPSLDLGPNFGPRNWLNDVWMPCVTAVETAIPDDPEMAPQLDDAAKTLELAGILMDGAGADGRILRGFVEALARKLRELD